MKTALVLLTITLAIMATGCGPSAAEHAQAWKDLDARISSERIERQERGKAELGDAKIEYAKAIWGLGSAKAQTYELCSASPPKVKANQVTCAKLDQQIMQSIAKAPKW